MMFVQGKPYRTNLVSTMKLATMREVKREFGFGWGRVDNFMRGIDADAPLGDLMCEDEFLAWAWGWMRNAGSEITRAELEQLTVDDINFGPDVVDQDDDTDGGDSDGAAGGGVSPTPAPSSKPKASGRGGAARKAAGKGVKSTGRSGTRSSRPSGSGS